MTMSTGWPEVSGSKVVAPVPISHVMAGGGPQAMSTRADM
jgi:hypothetical protein